METDVHINKKTRRSIIEAHKLKCNPTGKIEYSKFLYLERANIEIRSIKQHDLKMFDQHQTANQSR